MIGSRSSHMLQRVQTSSSSSFQVVFWMVCSLRWTSYTWINCYIRRCVIVVISDFLQDRIPESFHSFHIKASRHQAAGCHSRDSEDAARRIPIWRLPRSPTTARSRSPCYSSTSRRVPRVAARVPTSRAFHGGIWVIYKYTIQIHDIDHSCGACSSQYSTVVANSFTAN